MPPSPDHLDVTRDQFSRQAAAFASSPTMRNEEALQLLVRLADTTAEDTVLDVACGPGLVACAFAQTAQHVTGIDLTPAMIARAGTLQQSLGLANLSWQIGPAHPLPFPENHFSQVICRYAFHHFADPGAVLHEMTRVCQTGGRIVVANVVVPDNPAIAANFNQMEQLRDFSHVRALNFSEIEALGSECGLEPVETARYSLAVELDGLLAASFPESGGRERIREMFAASLSHDQLGLAPYQEGTSIRFAYPIAVLVWQKPES